MTANPIKKTVWENIKDGRRVTPVVSITNLIISGGSLGITIWLANAFVDNFTKRMDEFESQLKSSTASISSKVDALKDDQTSDTLKLTRRIAEIRIGCCSELRGGPLPSDGG